jgi:plasmid stabilization system protein ParE
MAGKKLVWTRRAQQHMAALFNYIHNDSPQNASIVIDDIVTALEKAMANPECYGPDKYKKANDGTYRAFEKHRFRVVYRYHKNIIRVLRVRHTSMEPKTY